MSVFDKGLITILACSALFAALALPLALRKVPRNAFYGYRTRATLSGDDLWYDVNACVGRWLLGGSAAAAALALALDAWRGLAGEAYLNVSIALLVAPAAVAALAAHLLVRRRLAEGAARR